MDYLPLGNSCLSESVLNHNPGAISMRFIIIRIALEVNEVEQRCLDKINSFFCIRPEISSQAGTGYNFFIYYMTLTFSEALQNLPILSSARVVAGKNGLGRAIRWTHIVDQPEVFSWVREGDLLVTTAFALKDNLDGELVMVEQMAQKGLAGMLVSIGRYINAVPENMISEADTLDFPIVIIPWEIPLVEVTHAIHEQIIRQQYQVTEQIYHIHDVLSQLVLEGGGLSQLAGQHWCGQPSRF